MSDPFDVEDLKAQFAQAHGQIMAVADQSMTIEFTNDHGLPPEGGWPPEAFPQVTVAPIPYTSDPMIRPDPRIHITDDGWLYIEVGNTRIALPDLEEFDKLTHMAYAMFNEHHRKRIATLTNLVNEASDDS